MNSRLAATNEKMAKVNALLIEINHEIMEGNQDVVEFNSKHIHVNTQLLAHELKPCAESGCTPEKNEARINDNSKRIAEIQNVAQANLEKHAGVLRQSEANRAEILKNSEEIYARRAQIAENHEKVAANAHKISAFILEE